MRTNKKSVYKLYEILLVGAFVGLLSSFSLILLLAVLLTLRDFSPVASLPIATNDYKLLKKVDKEFEKQNKFIECLFKEYEYGLSKSSELFRVIENHSQQQGEVYCR